jgi:hypothetical protein
LRIQYALTVRLPKIYRAKSDLYEKAYNICHIAFDAFFDDTKSLVTKGVRSDIAHRKASATTQKQFSELSDRAALRESSLASWLKLNFPLSYKESGGKEPYKLLLMAISPDDQTVAYGLPNGNRSHTTCSALADSLFRMSTSDNPSSIKAPVVRTGSFLPVLRVVNESLFTLAARSGVSSNDKRKVFVVNVFHKCLRLFDIKFVPSSKPATGAAGRPHSTPLYNFWDNLGGADASDIPQIVPAPRPVVHPATIAYNNITDTDCYADWSANGLKIENIKRILKKKTLPKDYTPPTGSSIAYVNNTYDWVRENYDANKPLHHLALLIAIIASNSILPYFYYPEKQKHLFKNADSRSDVRKIYEDMEWISKGKVKGMVEPTIFVAVFTTFIIALYEEDSPLRMHMKTRSRQGFGEPWREKHGQPFLFFLQFLSHAHLFSGEVRHLPDPHPSRNPMGFRTTRLRKGNIRSWLGLSRTSGYQSHVQGSLR